MDIHKPKPRHGLREFLKDYVIIEFGVPTALRAKAVVQGVHQHRLSAEARIGSGAQPATLAAGYRFKDNAASPSKLARR